MASSQAGVAVETIDGTFPVPTMFSGENGGKWILSDLYDFTARRNWHLKIKGKKKVE